MLSPRRRALAVDLALGLTALVFASVTRGTPRSVGAVLIAFVGLAVLASTLFVAEQTAVLAVIDRTRPMSLVVVAVALTAVGVAITVGQGVVAVPAATLLWGMGLGLVGYRLWFGLLTPLPQKRHTQAKLWGQPPEREERQRGRR